MNVQVQRSKAQRVRRSPRRRILAGLLVIAIATLVYSLPSSAWTGAGDDADRPWTPAELATLASLSPIADASPDRSNRVSTNEQAADLGRRLFFDTRLSANGSVSCATCHQAERYFTDGLKSSIGIQVVARNAPTLIGVQNSPWLYWDGRKDSLWAQAMAPFEAEAEMGTTRTAVVRSIYRRYRKPYEALFGKLPPMVDEKRFPPEARPIPEDPAHPLAQAWKRMTSADQEATTRAFVNITKCIAAYESKLLPREAPFDRYVRALLSGDPKGADELSTSAIRGLRAFIGKAGCIHCHNGPLFTDQSFHNTGLPLPSPDARPERARAQGAWQVLADPFRSDGRYGDDKSRKNPHLMYLNPGFEDLLGAYKTPTLRNIAKTGPYGHAGQIPDLSAMIEHYRKLPLAKFLGHRDLILKPLDPSIRTQDLVAFLQSLTGPLPAKHWLDGQ